MLSSSQIMQFWSAKTFTIIRRNYQNALCEVKSLVIKLETVMPGKHLTFTLLCANGIPQ